MVLVEFFFQVLNKLKSKGLTQLRIYTNIWDLEVVDGLNFQAYLGQQDRDFRLRFRL